MREILFRGKRTANGKWVEGYVFKQRNPANTEESYIRVHETDFNVIPETVCQFTGLFDKNGRKIFEGDIVRYSTNKVGIINYGTACFSVQDIKSRNNPALDIVFAEFSNVEVIGNIYNNPELLEVKK
ncbi:MAG: YopX family protein [Oscillospiraceae bacterium]